VRPEWGFPRSSGGQVREARLVSATESTPDVESRGFVRASLGMRRLDLAAVESRFELRDQGLGDREC
jgi:hypothetical protein